MTRHPRAHEPSPTTDGTAADQTATDLDADPGAAPGMEAIPIFDLFIGVDPGEA